MSCTKNFGCEGGSFWGIREYSTLLFIFLLLLFSPSFLYLLGIGYIGLLFLFIYSFDFIPQIFMT